MKPTESEIKARQKRDRVAKASLACEGITFTAEEDALFEEMDRLGLSNDERSAYIDAYCKRSRENKAE